jgi:exodeoxyribonuclease V gamma subunit
VIGELLDAVERMHGEAAREALCVEHPLQPFSPRAFGAGDDSAASRRFSYREEWRMRAERDVTTAIFAAAPLPPDEAEIALPDRDALQAFFANPAKHWLRTRLGLRLPGDEDEHDAREPMGGDALMRYHAIDALLSAADADIADPVPALRARALLPPGRDGVALAADACAFADRLRDARKQALGAAAATCVTGDGGDGAGIAFRFDDVHDGARVVLVAGRLDGKRRLRARIDHLLLAGALGEDARTHLIGPDGKTGLPIEAVYRGFDRATARAALEDLLALWHEGRDAPLPFAPKSAFAYAAAWHAKGDAAVAWKAARDAYAPFQGDGERDDAWLRLAFRPQGLLEDRDSAQAQRFREIAVRVFDAREPTP